MRLLSGKRHATLIMTALLALAAIPATVRSYRPSSTPQFDVPAFKRDTAAPQFSAEFLPYIDTAFVHASSVAELADGDLIAAWYGGSAEVRRDVRIFFARRDRRTGIWSGPFVLADQKRTEDALHIHVKSIGNPVLLADGQGVTLFYVAVLMGGWSGGTICSITSPDGQHWSEARRVYTAPFLNIGMLVRSKPWRYSDGTIALPIYHELARKWSAIARLDERGNVIDEVRLADGRPLIQPWLVPVGSDRAIALLRWSSRMPGCVTVSRSDDAGVQWSGISGTRLVHRDSAVAAVRMNDGSLLAAYNNSAWDRRDLSLARSLDGGVNWSRPYAVERDTTPDNAVRREYSYPFLFRTRDGMYHLMYTWQRSKIRHATFNEAWLLGHPELKVVQP